MRKYDSLISLNGTDPLFRENTPRDFDLINQKTFVNKFNGLQVAQNFRFVWEKSKDYLKQISKNRVYKKLFQASLNVAKNDLDFGNTIKAPTATLEQKIKKASSMQLKPTR